MSNNKKHYYVPWEGYAAGSQPDPRGDLDRLCLQGPHTQERAVQLAAEIRQAGFMASVIDCTATLSKAERLAERNAELLAELGRAADLIQRLGLIGDDAKEGASLIERVDAIRGSVSRG